MARKTNSTAFGVDRRRLIGAAGAAGAAVTLSQALPSAAQAAAVDGPLAPKYRMPRWFGAAPGPRNMPADQMIHANDRDQTTVSVSAFTDAAKLSALLPPRCTLWGEPTLTVTMIYLSNLGWLAGRGYSVVSLTIPIVFHGRDGDLRGDFTPVLWESMADPIITGREELGFAKLYADVPPARVLGDRYDCAAHWYGFPFFDLQASKLKTITKPPAPPPSDGVFHYRFMPRVGAQGQADVEYMALAPSPQGGQPVQPPVYLAGEGRFAFHPARWEDMPTQYPVVNALAALPLERFGPALVTQSSIRGGSTPEAMETMREVK